MHMFCVEKLHNNYAHVHVMYAPQILFKHWTKSYSFHQNSLSISDTLNDNGLIVMATVTEKPLPLSAQVGN